MTQDQFLMVISNILTANFKGQFFVDHNSIRKIEKINLFNIWYEGIDITINGENFGEPFIFIKAPYRVKYYEERIAFAKEIIEYMSHPYRLYEITFKHKDYGFKSKQKVSAWAQYLPDKDKFKVSFNFDNKEYSKIISIENDQDYKKLIHEAMMEIGKEFEIKKL